MADDPFVPLLRRASQELQAGRLAPAEALYRQVLADAPEHPAATHYLGLALVQSGRAAEGLPLLARSLELAPEQHGYRHNLALMLAQTGDLAGAERELGRVVAADPGNAGAHHYLGIVRQSQGRLADAETAYRAALERAPGDGAIAGNLGKCLLELGRVPEAIEALRRAIAGVPGDPAAHNTMGTALQAAGDLTAAIASYRKAIALAPGYTAAWFNLGLALRHAGDANAAFEAFHRAVETGPGFAPAWQAYADEFANSRFNAWNPAAAEALVKVLRHPGIDPGPLAEAAASLLVLDPRFAPLYRELSAADAVPPRWLGGDRLAAAAHPMLLALIEDAIVPDPAFEAFLVKLRRALFDAWRDGAVTAREPAALALACALAQQCFLNEYVWPESAEEALAVSPLADLVRGAPKALEVALVAAYRPLASLGALLRPLGTDAAFDRLWQRQVVEPETERRIAGEIDALTPIEDATSRAVRAQYEANPYPRWHRVPAAVATPYPLPRAVRELFPHVDAARFRFAVPPSILIAGCGTGYQAAITAFRNPGARILAVDLSRRSLAYAMRRCREVGAGHVQFAQADLLRLGTLSERFDAVEATGVLHHLRDPLAGWAALASLVKPGGVMRLALYSEIARHGVVAARALLAPHGLPGTLEGVRAARRLVLDAADAAPARLVTRSWDFYSASGTRDLVMHVQEHRFTLPEIDAAVRHLGLEFLGFELADPRAAAAYRRRFPHDAAMTSLADWAIFESENPDAFVGMYQFWVAKPA